MSKPGIAITLFVVGLVAGVAYGKHETDRWHAAHPFVGGQAFQYDRKIIQGFHMEGNCVFGGTDYNMDTGTLDGEGPCVIREIEPHSGKGAVSEDGR